MFGWFDIKSLPIINRYSEKKKKKCEKSYNTILLWSPTHSDTKISVTQLRIKKKKKIWFGFNGAVCLKKDPNMFVSGLDMFWNIIFVWSKVIFFAKLEFFC